MRGGAIRIARVLLLGWLAGLSTVATLAARASAPGPHGAPATTQDLDASLTCEPAEARIGDPLTWTLLVWHDRDESLELPADLVPPDDTWVLVDGPRRARVPAGDGALTRVEWTVLSLEPGVRELPTLELALDGGVTLVARPGSVSVAGELAEGEDAPRPLPEPGPVPDAAGDLSSWRWVLPLPPVLLLLLLLALVQRRRRSRARRDRTDLPEPALARLQRAVPDPERLATSDDRRAHAGVLTHLLQENLEEGAGPRHPGLARGEWLARLERAGQLDGERAVAVDALLEELETVRFGGVEPTLADLAAWHTRALELARGGTPSGSAASGVGVGGRS